MAPTYTKLKGVYDFNTSTPNDQIEANLISFFSWGLLSIGGFENTRYTAGNSYQVPKTKLSKIDDVGKVWQGFRSDWVWESGIDYGRQPIQVSGVYVNGNFYGPNHSTYGHKVDYPNGRIVFNGNLPANSVVNAEFSYRYYNIQSADTPWFREVQFNSFQAGESQFIQYGSGTAAVLSQNRVQLPAIAVEIAPERSFEGLQLGGGHYLNQDVNFHIFAENPWDRKKFIDVLTCQENKTIAMFDKNAIANADKYPLDYNGSIRAGAMTYPQLIAPTGESGFYWKSGTFTKSKSFGSVAAPPLYQAVARTTFKVILQEI